MTSAPMRDPLADHLLTPQNAALLLIDYQPSIPDKFAQWDAAYVLGALSSAERREFEEYLAALPDGRLGAGRHSGFAGPGITSVPDDELMAELIATPRIGPWTLQGGCSWRRSARTSSCRATRRSVRPSRPPVSWTTSAASRRF
jgi:hypothetical protein